MGHDVAELTLPDDVTLCHQMIRELIEAHRKQGRELDGTRHRLDQLLRRLYGPKQEKLNPNQPTLFDAFTPPAPPPVSPPLATPADALPEPAPKKRKGHGRKGLPKDLPRFTKQHDLSDSEKMCPCCQGQREKIGEEKSEQLDYRPASLFVWEHVRFKYACLKCLAKAKETTKETLADPSIAMPASPIDGNQTSEAESTADSTIPAAEIFAMNGAEISTVTTSAMDSSESINVSPIATPVIATNAAEIPPTTAATTVDISALIVTAAKPAQPIDKGLPGPGLLAHIVVSKYVDHLPLYRQEAILGRQGVEVSRSTMSDWMAAMARLLTPLYDLMLSLVLASRVIQTDETLLPVLDGADKTKSGRLWIYLGDRNHPYLIYDYRPDKSRAGPDEILKNYKGFLQADAANVFDGIYRPGNITEAGCWAHARRKFFEAKDSDVARSAEAIARISQFYRVEHEARDEIARDGLVGEAADAVRFRLRQEKTVPLLAKFHEWILEQQKIALPKSPIGQAIQYALNHWRALNRFTEHGFLNIDNNAAERSLRAVAVGRKNYLFAGSDQGGKTAAVLYSISQTCNSLAIDPFAYLQDVLTRLPELPATQLETLLPDRWAQTQRDTAAGRS